MSALETEEEFCPSCGTFKILNERTGFCSSCDGEADRCERCGNESDSNGRDRPNSGNHRFCWRCREEIWVENNADAIERYMAQGYPVQLAKDLVKRDSDTKLNCWSCGEEIRPTPNGTSYFCTKTVRCKAARRRMKYLIYNKVPALKKETALEQVMKELE